MRDAQPIEEALQRSGIGNPRHHVTVRADWPRAPSPVWPEVVPILIGLGAVAYLLFR